MAKSKRNVQPEEETRIRIVQDTDAESPRDWDNMGTMACWHRRYTLGDVQPNIDPEEYIAGLEPNSLILPLYLYDHSGITMRTHSFGDVDPGEWDSGQVGIIYVEPAKIISEYGADTPEAREKAKEVLIGEVAVYDQYLTGDVWGFVLETAHKCDHGDTHWDTIDSCWGFFGSDPFENGMAEHLEEKYHDLLKKAQP